MFATISFGKGMADSKATPQVQTIAGNGTPGYSAEQVNNPYGLVVGPDGALYFCDLDNQRIRRLDLTTRKLTTIAGSGKKGYAGDGGPALTASLNMPHELRFDKAGDVFVAERDNHVIRKINRKTDVISTVAGTGVAALAATVDWEPKRNYARLTVLPSIVRVDC
jgi:DNA-binding beta-propeller fold protein YncE